MKESDQIKHDLELAIKQMEKLLQNMQQRLADIKELFQEYDKKTGNRRERKEDMRRWSKF